jgi:putative ABC transport system permease protein
MPLSNLHIIDAGYFKTMGVPLRRGRSFELTDTATAPLVAIINEAMARRYWPGQDPLGRHLGLRAQASAALAAVIIGVAADTRQTALSASGEDDFYLHYLQRPRLEMSLVVRTASEPLRFARAVEEQVQSLDADLPIGNVRTLSHMLLESLAPQRISAILLGVLAALGLGLSSIGIYGLVFSDTRRRTREIGVRMALGATRPQVLGLVAGRAARLFGIGVLVGWVAAFGATRALQSLLFSVGSFDLPTYVTATLVLAAVGILASLIPALHATRVDPSVALGVE